MTVCNVEHCVGQSMDYDCPKGRDCECVCHYGTIGYKNPMACMRCDQRHSPMKPCAIDDLMLATQKFVNRNIRGEEEKWLYYRELRLDRLREKFNQGTFTIKDFYATSCGIALAKQISDLEL